MLSKKFKGADITNVFGGAEINLSQADMESTATMDLTNVFGGTKLIIPAHWEINSELVSVFGSIEDKRPIQPNTATGDKKVLMISIVSPVLSGGEFKGIAGIDVSLDFFQKMTDEVKLPTGGRVIIFDDAGTIVGFTGNAKAIYKNVFTEKFDGYENFSKERITNKEDFHLGDLNLSALRPIHLDGKTWFAEVIIPKSIIMAPIQAALYKQIVS